jgi:predicted metalloprotease with PDZ domain
VGDELLALNGQRVRAEDDLAGLLGESEQPQTVEVLFCRDGTVRSLPLRSDPAVVARWRLQSLEQPDVASLDRRRRWLELRP